MRRALGLIGVALAALDRFEAALAELEDPVARAQITARTTGARRVIEHELPLFLALATQTESALRGDAIVANAIFETRRLRGSDDPVELAHAVIKRLRDPEPPPTSSPDAP